MSQPANTLPTNLIMMKGATVLGCPVAIHTQRDPTIRTARLQGIHDMLDAKMIRPLVSQVFPLAEAGEALRAKWLRKVTGNCVLDCS